MKEQFLPIQPLSGTTLTNYWQLLKQNKFDIDVKYVPRVFYTMLVSAIATTPLAIIEKWQKGKIIEQSLIKYSPIFIIGHWRSGTTYLNYLLSKDENFNCINNAQSFFPNYMFHHFPKIITKVIGLHIPKKRPMDDVLLGLDCPQEEEFALGNLGVQSCYHWWTFPKKMRYYFDKYVLLKQLSEVEQNKFQSLYLKLLKKVNLIAPNKRLLIKNPVNTGRIPFLLKLFPNAQFIYLKRNPQEVYYSTIKLHTKLLKRFSFQQIENCEIEKNTKAFYKELIEKYENDKLSIPNKNLIEVDYQNLINQPLEVVKEIYSYLNINGFEKSATVFNDYISLQKNYRIDSYPEIENKPFTVKWKNNKLIDLAESA